MTDILPDAAPGNWVDRRAPERLRPWLRLGRLDRPAGVWLLLLPGCWGVAIAAGLTVTWPDPVLLAKFAVGATLMRAAGCAFNDIVDRDIDAKVARTAARPVASGRISVRQAWAFVVGCSLVSFLILLTLGPAAIVLGFVSLGLVAAYPFMKRITWWPQAWLGLTFNWGALMGFAAAIPNDWIRIDSEGSRWIASFLDISPEMMRIAAAGAQAAIFAPAVLLYAAGVFWTLGYDTIYAVQDLEDDALAGVKSSARRLGTNVRPAVLAFYAAASFLALMAGLSAVPGLVFLVGWAAFSGHLLWQARRIRLDDPALCLRLFKSNRDAGLVLFAAIALGGVWR